MIKSLGNEAVVGEQEVFLLPEAS
jgi:hypothetical protein